MTNSIFEPLQLSAGTHKPGSGRGCAMNVISWENGDTKITDFPACSDRYLSILVQHFNDTVAKRDPVSRMTLLSPEDSILALELGHMTVGTSYHSLSEEDLQRVYYKMVVAAFEWYNSPRVVIQALMDMISMTTAEGTRVSDRAAANTIEELVLYDPRYTKEKHYSFVKNQIEVFQQKTGTVPVTIPEEKTQEAVAKMLVCTV
jgi:hypothetical protein